MTEEILSKICSWAQGESAIRAAILIGSRAIERGGDELSDYDISLFTNPQELDIQDDSWLSFIGKHWVCVHEKLPWKDKIIPTRLVIFEGGVKVDFAFYPLETLVELSQSNILPDDYDAGYQVLLDKDSLTKEIPQPSLKAFQCKKPSRIEFERVILEFWFEAYHVAKYLKRGDLWIAKFRDWGMKDPFLLTMICWNRAAKHAWEFKTHSQGKAMQSWVSEVIWKELHGCFSHFDAEDAWKSLEKMTSLFRRLALETASNL